MNRSTITQLISACVGSAILLNANSALSNPYVDRVDAQFWAVAERLGFVPYELAYIPKIYELDQGNNHVFTFNFKKGYEYNILAVCDRDCSDIDLTIYDENGNFIAEDVNLNDTPWLQVTPYWTNNFQVRVDMVTCSQNPCYYGIGVFSR